MGTATFRPRALAGGTRAGSARALNATPTLLTLRTPQRMAVRSRTRTSLTAGSPTPAYPLLQLGRRTRSSGRPHSPGRRDDHAACVWVHELPRQRHGGGQLLFRLGPANFRELFGR